MHAATSVLGFKSCTQYATRVIVMKWRCRGVLSSIKISNLPTKTLHTQMTRRETHMYVYTRKFCQKSNRIF